MTAGRYYRSPDNAPAVPSPTYLGSREWTPKKLDQEYGEWGGDQFPDNGTPPHILPRGPSIGGDCLGELREAPAAGSAAAQNGRCVVLPSGAICGNVPLFANFSLAYANGEITYWRQVPTYITKDDGEGEWSGRVPELTDAVARVRVTEDDDAIRNWSFAICDRSPVIPPVVTGCCGSSVAGQLFLRHRFILQTGGTEDWSIEVVNVAATYNTISGYWESDESDPNAQFSVGKMRWRFACFSLPGGFFWLPWIEVFSEPSGGGAAAWRDFDAEFRSAVLATCGPPFSLPIGKHLIQGPSYFYGVDGHFAAMGQDWYGAYTIQDTPF